MTREALEKQENRGLIERGLKDTGEEKDVWGNNLGVEEERGCIDTCDKASGL